MNLHIGKDIIITEPNPQIMTYINENLVLNNPEYYKKKRLGLWLGKTPSKIELYTRSGNCVTIPYGCLKDIWKLKEQNDTIETFFKEEVENIDYGDPVPLYDYQKKAVQELKQAQLGILQSKAGSGKTQIGIALTKELGLKTLWLTHTIDLLNQSKQRAERYMDKSLIGTIANGKVHIGKGITFATVQTMSKLDLPLYKNEWDLIIVDECHRVAGTPNQLTMFYKVLTNLCARHKYGLSATVHRADGMIKGAYALLGKIAYTVPDEEVIDKVMKVGVIPVFTRCEMSLECKNEDGTINYAKFINYITTNEERNDLILQALIKNKGHSCLILSERLEHLQKLRDSLPPDMYIESAFINGKMTSKKEKEERAKVLDDMRNGKLKYLFASHRLASEGLDIPRLDRLFLASPIKDFTPVTQSLGRIARTFENKVNALCYDFVDSSRYAFSLFDKRKTIYRKNHAYLTDEDINQ